MEHKWGAIMIIGILLVLGGNEAYDKYLKHELQLAKVQHGCVVEAK
jgi:hypothetical protein